jgi:hypothetical protein
MRAALMLLALCPLGCDEGKSLFDRATRAEQAHDYEQARLLYEQAAADPDSSVTAQAQAKFDEINNNLTSAAGILSDVDALVERGEYFRAAGGLRVVLNRLPGYEPAVRKLALVDEQRQAHRLGGGYKEAKWGMSKAQVKQVLGGTVDRWGGGESTDFLALDIDGKGLKCWFAGDRLYRVEFNPRLADADVAGVDAILALAVEKFGPGTERTDRGDATTGLPLMFYEWEDSDTTIKFRVVKPRPELYRGTASSLKVIYEHKAGRAGLEAAQQQKAGEAAERRARENDAKFRGDL